MEISDKKEELSPEEAERQKYLKNKETLADDEKLWNRLKSMKAAGSSAGWRGAEDEKGLQDVIDRYTKLGDEISKYELKHGLRPSSGGAESKGK